MANKTSTKNPGRLLVLLCLVLRAASVTAQNYGDSAVSISSKDAREDLQTFKAAMLEHHPSFYRYKSKKELMDLFDSCHNALKGEVPLPKFYGMFKHLVAAVGDGHLSVSMGDWKTINKQPAKVFPLVLYFVHDSAFVYCEPKNRLEPGIPILAINGQPVHNLVGQFSKYLSSDGYNTSKKRWILNKNFWFYYYLIYGEYEKFEISYPRATETLTTQLAAASSEKDLCPQKDTLQKKFKIHYVSDSIALLSIRSFSEEQPGQEKFTDFLEKTFGEIRSKKIKTLIIDLRQNGGGRDVYGALLYAYLTDQPFSYYRSLVTTHHRLKKSEHPNLNIQHPAANPFMGKVLILTDGLSFSATAEFCAVARNYNRAIFIGEETGGAYEGNTSGKFFRFKLPHSGLGVNIPLTKYTMEVKPAREKGRGIVPDIEILPTVTDVLQSRDVQLLKAIEMAKKH